ncbi:hypothetical protein UFOVP329_28 [uncultured Caudovirales phage]|uniref:Uncharacterized protein n=1 Tax=uncultured Caudovirales phage TaxID=2100421 RepID=A0A6J5LZI5_9CAUD|nr:hypothetical protein UFOVP329_28 [uncultured Caudovirales phage]
MPFPGSSQSSVTWERFSLTATDAYGDRVQTNAPGFPASVLCSIDSQSASFRDENGIKSVATRLISESFLTGAVGDFVTIANGGTDKRFMVRSAEVHYAISGRADHATYFVTAVG